MTPLPTPRLLRHTGTRSASKQLCARALSANGGKYKDRTKSFTLIHLFNIFVLLSFFPYFKSFAKSRKQFSRQGRQLIREASCNLLWKLD